MRLRIHDHKITIIKINKKNVEVKIEGNLGTIKMGKGDSLQIDHMLTPQFSFWEFIVAFVLGKDMEVEGSREITWKK